MNLVTVAALFNKVRPTAAFSSLRTVTRTDRYLSVRNGVVEPLQTFVDEGAMTTVYEGGGYGYGATADLSETGLRNAFQHASSWAKASARCPVTGISHDYLHEPKGSYRRIGVTGWDGKSVAEKIERLKAAAARLKQGQDIVDHAAGLISSRITQVLVTAGGGEIVQEYEFLTPVLNVTAFRDGVSETRSFAGGSFSRQGGLELLDAIGFEAIAARLPDEARQLLHAPHCPAGTMDIVLAPDQMILQIHESIGHPLELDRILGDERNFAGTSFVTPDMFGSYQYGSELLNICFDPSHAGEISSYAFDDEGTPAEKVFLIEKGVLKRGLGGLSSQHRSGLPGVPTTRATSWNRPPIDRMANLNLEPGSLSLEQLIGKVERGVFMQTNCSWSIDDSRNKFQFGCEWGQLIENGKLTKVVRKPSYRGISASFWRTLGGVGSAATAETLGTLYCGKGEPNQAIHVGHATPACLFTQVAVFGGE